MTSVFDGMTGVLGAVFGAPVILTRQGLAPVSARAIFRETPVEDDVGDGRTAVTLVPSLKLSRSEGVLSKGDTVEPGNGASYRVLQPIPSTSPASDSFVTYLMEKVQP